MLLHGEASPEFVIAEFLARLVSEVESSNLVELVFWSSSRNCNRKHYNIYTCGGLLCIGGDRHEVWRTAYIWPEYFAAAPGKYEHILILFQKYLTMNNIFQTLCFAVCSYAIYLKESNHLLHRVGEGWRIYCGIAFCSFFRFWVWVKISSSSGYVLVCHRFSYPGRMMCYRQIFRKEMSTSLPRFVPHLAYGGLQIFESNLSGSLLVRCCLPDTESFFYPFNLCFIFSCAFPILFFFLFTFFLY